MWKLYAPVLINFINRVHAVETSLLEKQRSAISSKEKDMQNVITSNVHWTVVSMGRFS